VKYDPPEVRKRDIIIASDLEVVARRGALGFGATAR
jgi:putative transposon-encoded protein